MATIAAIILAIVIVPMVTRGFAAFGRKIRERRERRRAAENEEEDAMELAAWRALGGEECGK